MIAAKGILCLTNRDDINTLAWLQSQLPVIVGHTCNNMIVGELPVFADMTVFYPDIRILLCECNVHHGILHKDRRMGFPVVVHDLPLVVLQILYPHRR